MKVHNIINNTTPPKYLVLRNYYYYLLKSISYIQYWRYTYQTITWTSKPPFFHPSQETVETVASNNSSMLYFKERSKCILCQLLAALVTLRTCNLHAASAFSLHPLLRKPAYYYKLSTSIRSPNTQLQMGLEINIRIVGRKNSIESTSFLQESYNTYSKRLSSSSLDLKTTFHKSNAELVKNLQIF